MGFDINAVNGDGEMALHRMFKCTSLTAPKVQYIIDKFLKCKNQQFDTEYFMEYLAKYGTICGQTALGTCVLRHLGLHRDKFRNQLAENEMQLVRFYAENIGNSA